MTSVAPPRPRALSIAGSDSGGGAGIQADLKTFSVLGVFGMTAITAVTVQNTTGVWSYETLSPRTVGDQIRAVATDIGVDAAKTGMLASAEIVEAVADAVAETGIRNLVVDPVFVSKHGHALLAEDAVASLRERILPLARIVTPNLPEAAGLTGLRVDSREQMVAAAEAILAMGPAAVLVKGGHLEGSARADDLFVDGDAARVGRGRAPGDAAHPRHRLRAVLRDHRLPGERRGPPRRRPPGQVVRDRGDPPRAPDRRGHRPGGPALRSHRGGLTPVAPASHEAFPHAS